MSRTITVLLEPWAATGASGKRSAIEVAEDLGFSYRKKGEKGFAAGFSDLREIPKRSTIKHVIEGELDGRPLVAFESSYVVSTGQTTMVIAHTVYAAGAPDWPATHVTPRNFFARILMKLGRTRGLALENPDFNLRFKVKTDNEDFAIALLSPEMQAFLLEKTGARWRIGRGRVCLIYSGTLKAARIEASLDRMRRFWALVPPELEAW